MTMADNMTLTEQIRREIQSLLDEVEGFLQAKEMTATGFGRAAIGDPNFVFDLRKGRDVRPETVDRVRSFMRAPAPAESAA